MEIDAEDKEDDPIKELNQKKNEKTAQEKQDLLNKVLSGNIETVRERVGYILNNSTEARNSDRELAWLYWKTFQPEIFNGHSITKPEFYKLIQTSSLTRSRAKKIEDSVPYIYVKGTGYPYSKNVKMTVVEKLNLDSIYEAKAYDWITKHIDYKKEKTLFWVVGNANHYR